MRRKTYSRAYYQYPRLRNPEFYSKGQRLRNSYYAPNMLVRIFSLIKLLHQFEFYILVLIYYNRTKIARKIKIRTDEALVLMF